MFPNDVLLEILQRLPLKPLFKFKCVSKGWNFLISEPSFKRSYELRSKGVGSSVCGFFYYDDTRNRRTYDDDKDDYGDDDDDYNDDDYNDGNIDVWQWGWIPKYVGPTRFHSICYRDDQKMPNYFDFIDKLGHVIASCKGLLLVTSPPKVGHAPNYYVWNYYVCDPVTGKYHELPPTLEEYKLATHGFLCEEGGHYKVICAYPLSSNQVIKIETFSSKSGQWKKSVITIPARFDIAPFGVAKVMGEVLYWREYCIHGRFIAYDPNDPKQCCKLIEVPKIEWDDEDDPDENDEDIVGYRGHGISETEEGYLRYFRFGLHIEIFVLNEPTRSWYNKEEVIGQERWNLIHKIDMNKLKSTPTEWVSCYQFNPLDPHCLFLLTSDNKVLSSYDYIDERVDEICSFDFNGRVCEVFYQHPLWPCLC